MAVSLKEFDASGREAYGAGELRLLYQLYEEAQRSRIANGERLRAILQGRSLIVGPRGKTDVGPALKAIGRGEHGGAPVLLERAYARAAADESAAADALREAIEDHPAWSWVSSVRGVGHLLAARVLSRLDVARAKTPSAFWAYCGLGTIPGVRYRCPECGLEVAYPVGYQPRGPHRAPRDGRDCARRLEPDFRAQATRVAPRRTIIGGRSGYDAQAREACYLVGISMLRCGSEYRTIYDSERARLLNSRPGWSPKHRHLAALRKMEKAFLRDLWIAWREAVDLPVVPRYFPTERPSYVRLAG